VINSYEDEGRGLDCGLLAVECCEKVGEKLYVGLLKVRRVAKVLFVWGGL
jgi:hypothetical protein